MTKFLNKANIVFAGFDRKSGLHTLVYCIPSNPSQKSISNSRQLKPRMYYLNNMKGLQCVLGESKAANRIR